MESVAMNKTDSILRNWDFTLKRLQVNLQWEEGKEQAVEHGDQVI